MKKYRYSETEQQVNNVLKHQEDRIANLHFPDLSGVNQSISQSESLLRSLGYTPEKLKISPISDEKPLIIVPSWHELCVEAENAYYTHSDLQELFSVDELTENSHAIQQLNQEYGMVHKLDSIDITISVAAGLAGALIDILLVGIPCKRVPGKVNSEKVALNKAKQVFRALIKL